MKYYLEECMLFWTVTDETGNKFWYVKTYLHRENGPAIEYSSGEKEWYIKGKRLTKEAKIIKTNLFTKCYC